MSVRGRLPGFYEARRPDLTVPYPGLQFFIHEQAGAFLDSRKPSGETRWRCEAEVRYIISACIAARIPWDSPPELAEIARVDEDGGSIAAKDYETAFSAERSALAALSEN